MPDNQTTLLAVNLVTSDGKELFWPHSHVPRVGEIISMKTGDDYTVNRVTYNLVDAAGGFTANVLVSR